jgi:hypothetical protein
MKNTSTGLMIFFYVKRILRRHFFSGNCMKLKFERRISKSRDNRSTLVVIPRAIAQAWQEHDTVELVFDGNSLVITPKDDGSEQDEDA